MIALYSPRYFLDRGCGLEWAVIQSRMRRRANIEGVQGPGCLIPVCWKPVAERLIPQEVRRSESFPGPGAFDWLREQGLEALVSSSDPGADERYYVFVEQLTKSILEAGRAGLAPLGADEARDTLPAFGSAQGAAGPGGRHLRVPEQPDPRHESAAGEPRSVAISYVGADQAWADWMDGVLREEGHTVRQRRRMGRARDSVAGRGARTGRRRPGRGRLLPQLLRRGEHGPHRLGGRLRPARLRPVLARRGTDRRGAPARARARCQGPDAGGVGPRPGRAAPRRSHGPDGYGAPRPGGGAR